MSAKWVMLALAFCGSVNATTVFGIKLGAPLAMRECSYSRIDASTVIFNPPNHGRCYQLTSTSGRTALRPNDNIFVNWAQTPAISTGSADVQLVGGKVEGIGVNTAGIETQQVDLQSLISKFGKPSQLENVPMGNAMGATFKTVRARWLLVNGTHVTYLSADNRIDRGLISISTPAGRAYTRAQLTKLNTGSGL